MAQIIWRSRFESTAHEVSEDYPLPTQVLNNPVPAVAVATNLEAITVTATAVGLTAATYADSATAAEVYVETAPVRVRFDGQLPTSSVGILLNPGDCLPLQTFAEMANFKAIRTTGTSGALTVVYLNGPPLAQRIPIRKGQFVDSAGNVNVNQNTQTAGEDTAVGVVKVEQRFGYTNITAAAPTNTTVKSGAGFLHCITFNKPIATHTCIAYDNTSASSPIIASITIPANPQMTTFVYDVAFATGLFIVTGTAASDITVSWR